MSADYIINFSGTLDGTSNKSGFVIKPNTTNGPATPHSLTLHSGAVSANTSLVLLGKGNVDYGSTIASNFVHLLENFAARTEPTYPTTGQLWYDTGNNTMRVWNGTSWVAIQPTVSATQPPFASLGAMWYDSTTGSFRYYNGTAWTDMLSSMANYMPLAGGTMQGNITFATNATVTGLPLPTQNSDAASKQYVDDVLAAGLATKANVTQVWPISSVSGLQSALNQALPLSGGTMSGAVALAANSTVATDPTLPLHIANKQYVDSMTASVGGASSLSTLSDVAFVGLSDYNIMYFDASVSKWKNGDATTAGVLPTSHASASNAHTASSVSFAPPFGVSSTNLQSLGVELAVGRVNKSGDVMQGDLSMANHSVIGLRTPIGARDATPKDYVDSRTTKQRRIFSITSATDLDTPPFYANAHDIMAYLNGVKLYGSTPAHQTVDFGHSIASTFDSTNLASNDNVYTSDIVVTAAMPVMSVTSSTITVPGRLTTILPASTTTSVVRSANNNGTYTVTNSTYDSLHDTTTITVTPSLPTVVADGMIVINTTHHVAIKGSNAPTFGDVIYWTINGFNEPIVGVDATAHTFTIVGDYTTALTATSKLTVINSASNGGVYTVTSSSFANGNTTITVSEPIASSVVDGSITANSIPEITMQLIGGNLVATTSYTTSYSTITITNTGSHPLWSSLVGYVSIVPSVAGQDGAYREDYRNSYINIEGNRIITGIVLANASTGLVEITTLVTPL